MNTKYPSDYGLSPAEAHACKETQHQRELQEAIYRAGAQRQREAHAREEEQHRRELQEAIHLARAQRQQQEHYRQLLAVGPPSSGGGCGGPTSGLNPYEQPITKPELAHRVRHNPTGGTYDVLGPNGEYRKAYHHKDEAEAIAAFWSGDFLHAEEYRRRVLCREGHLKPEDL